MGHIENKVPPPKDYPGGCALFFRGTFCLIVQIKEPKSNNSELSTALLVLISDMKLGMMDVGILCKDPRFGISTEKGTACDLHPSYTC